MPYAIPVTNGPEGVASYQLGGHEEWQLQSGSVLFDMTYAAGDEPMFLEARAPTGSVICRQLLYSNAYPTFLSFATGAEPFFVAYGEDKGWPQLPVLNYTTATVRVAPLTLTPGCTLYLYVENGAPSPFDDPLTNLDAGVVVSNGLLWVEDTNAAAGRQLEPVGPYMLVPGPGAAT